MESTTNYPCGICPLSFDFCRCESKAPETCMYCDGDGYNSRANTPCGFCVEGKPLDTQEDWNNSWGRLREIERKRREK